jgi:hypothetical protein
MLFADPGQVCNPGVSASSEGGVHCEKESIREPPYQRRTGSGTLFKNTTGARLGAGA